VSAQTEQQCCKCGKSSLLVRLETCVICHRWFCRGCAVRRHGKRFCERQCADFFFFGDAEDEPGA